MARKYPDAEIMFDNLSGMTVEKLRKVDDFIRFIAEKILTIMFENLEQVKDDYGK